MSIVLAISVAMLAVAAVATVARMTIGPTMLDRAVALDVFVAIAICGLAIEAAINRHTFTVPILLVLTLLGFVGSVSVARFTKGSDDIEAERS
ncbi:cation:proton antiporter [Nocardioides sp. zg-536]|uniref:Cation:proton antiporter n=1 Tax=Nocardioides faecalis TaxID=2803858 RepID=A0A939BYP3_9ACTN|nr:monovalent cation/H+ antiporter complex subunit F [Nocardioides faecalis]MBM9460165.1 cation:proton antiporter [Nocardioides faecalis]MBS4754264.1 cation:proton antiporter [Nocardioides faecalis]QVI60040.1 cation:proton antiporter [Nocardioides faecalis]